MVATISQCLQVSNHHVVHVKIYNFIYQFSSVQSLTYLNKAVKKTATELLVLTAQILMVPPLVEQGLQHCILCSGRSY